MVLDALGRRLQASFQQLTRASDVDEALLDSLLKDICTALLESDVNVKLVANLRSKVKAKLLTLLNNSNTANKKSVVQRTVFEELVNLVDPNASAAAAAASTSSAVASTSNSLPAPTDQAWKPKKGVSNVLMMVGLQGAGKTTSCTKLAVHYQRRGYKACLVCADTFRAGAFDQLKQNSTKAKIPFFGSYTETDPVAIASQGVQKFRAEKFEVIIVDTSGRHRQEAELFEEMKEIGRAVQPDLTIMVLDGAIGQAAESQSRAFKDAAGFSGIIVTKMDGHARGGGAISAVAATKTPILFIGTGEHLSDLERFSPQPFISKMLGMGDMQGLMDKVQEVQAMRDPKQQEAMLSKLEKGGHFSIRDLREQMNTILQMGPLSKVAAMIPGMSQMFSGAGGGGNDADMSAGIKRIMYITDSMSTAELDSNGSMFHDAPSKASDKASSIQEGYPREPNKRILRVAKGSGTSVREVEEVLAQHRMFGEMIKKMGPLAGMLKGAQGGAAGSPGVAARGRGRGMPSLNSAQMAKLQSMQSMLPPDMQGPGGLEKIKAMAAAMQQGGNMPSMESMKQMARNFPGMGSMF